MKKEFNVDKLKVLCFDTRNEMGIAGAEHAASLIRYIYKKNGNGAIRCRFYF